MTFDTAHSEPQQAAEPAASMPAFTGAWRTTEEAALRRLYPAGGADAVRAELPHRSLTAIRVKAAAMRVKCTKGSTTGLRFARVYEQRDDIDTMVREGYIHAKAKGDIKRLAERIGRPAWWVQKRAASLGMSRTNRTRLDGWTDDEMALLDKWAACVPKVISIKLRQAGFSRTEVAVSVKLKRLKIDRFDPNRWTATEVAPLLGVNPATVADWVERRGLPAKRETWGPHGKLMISRDRLRSWISKNRGYIDLRRVDQVWFFELLFGPAA